MDIDEKLELCSRNVEEIITFGDLKRLFEKQAETGKNIRGYVGVEPSGKFHIAHLIWVRKVKDLMEAGIEMDFLEATWHAQINNKLGGDIEKIRVSARYLEYCLEALGVDVKTLHFKTAEELMSNLEYWTWVMKAAKKLSLARIKRSMTIMGRKQDEADQDFSMNLYPLLQISDIFYGKYNVCLGGMDQRKAHMLARDVGKALKIKFRPVGIHTPLLSSLSGESRMEMGLDKEEAMIEFKMSKSKPGSAIFIHDSPKKIAKKLAKAFCPPKTVENNPIIDLNRLLLFSQKGFVLKIERKPEHGGDLEVTSLDDLCRIYQDEKLHPGDLKSATARAIADLLKPAREFFEKNDEAAEVLEQMNKFQVSR
ncbi:MAG: tyrosine--tRNA ligase [Candidatus Helarchaeota archaeon]